LSYLEVAREPAARLRHSWREAFGDEPPEVILGEFNWALGDDDRPM
jgi:hypothetical protein